MCEKILWCPTCKKGHQLVGWERGDPLLDCGHVKLRTSDDDVVYALRESLSNFIGGLVKEVKRTALENTISIDQARDIVLDKYKGDEL